MLLELKKNCIYGPVNSRRLGPSLGLNILAGGSKVCSFNCAYCQYGWTDFSLLAGKTPLAWPSPDKLERELRAALRSLPQPPAYLTFSGNGEATLHPLFGEMVDLVTVVRNDLAPKAKTAILSNSSTVGGAAVRDTISRLDVRIMKLDCGDEQTFSRYNNPCPDVTLDKITAGLESLNDVTIQSLFAGGVSGNLNRDNIEGWLARLQKIRPGKVQIYSLDRGTPDSRLTGASTKIMNNIKSQLEKKGIQASVFSRDSA